MWVLLWLQLVSGQFDHYHVGSYTTEEACRRLSMNADMSASFSRALSEGLYVHQTDDEFDQRLGQNIQDILEACR